MAEMNDGCHEPELFRLLGESWCSPNPRTDVPMSRLGPTGRSRPPGGNRVGEGNCEQPPDWTESGIGRAGRTDDARAALAAVYGTYA